MIKYVEILKDIMENVRLKTNITNILDNTDNTYTITVNDLGDLKNEDFIYIYDTNFYNGDYKLFNINILNKTLDINKNSGLLNEFGKLLAYKPLAYIDTTIHVIKNRDNIKRDTQKYPFVFFDELGITVKPLYYNGFISNYLMTLQNVYFFDQIDQRNDTEIIRDEVTYKMQLLAEKFLEAAENTYGVLNVEYQQLKHLNRYGLNNEFGYIGLPFNEYLSGVVINNLKLNLSNKIINCN